MLFRFDLPDRDEIRNSPNGRKMLGLIEDDSDAFGNMITGCPGSGKTTVSIYRFIYLFSKGNTAYLLTFQKMLRHAIKNLILTKFDGNEAEYVNTFYRWLCDNTHYFDFENATKSDQEVTDDLIESFKNINVEEVIIDEAQDLPKQVFRTIPNLFKRIMIGADNAQQIHSSGAREEEILDSLDNLGKGIIKKVELQYNYRNSFEIYNFARHFVLFDKKANDTNLLERLKRKRAELPVIYLVDSDDVKLDRLRRLLKNTKGNIAVLLAGRLQVNDYYKKIKSFDIDCSWYHSDLRDVPEELQRILITTYKSAKGLEFDAVILPYTDFQDDPIKRREYYVACTRAKRNLFIICYKKIDDLFSEFDANSFEIRDLRGTSASPEDIPF
jgi:DNA helicase IV